jgi:hypothetical protein
MRLFPPKTNKKWPRYELKNVDDFIFSILAVFHVAMPVVSSKYIVEAAKIYHNLSLMWRTDWCKKNKHLNFDHKMTLWTDARLAHAVYLKTVVFKRKYYCIYFKKGHIIYWSQIQFDEKHSFPFNELYTVMCVSKTKRLVTWKIYIMNPKPMAEWGAVLFWSLISCVRHHAKTKRSCYLIMNRIVKCCPSMFVICDTEIYSVMFSL